jgi:hypothetical protein
VKAIILNGGIGTQISAESFLKPTLLMIIIVIMVIVKPF